MTFDIKTLNLKQDESRTNKLRRKRSKTDC